MRRFIVLVLIGLPEAAGAGEIDAKVLRLAVEKGIQRIEQGARNYPKNRQCFSCHHQAGPMLTLNAARQHGLAVDVQVLHDQVEFTLRSFQTKARLDKGQLLGGTATTAGYALLALAAAHHPYDDTVRSLVEYLLTRQCGEGHWRPHMRRPPSEGSNFTATAVSLAGLREYRSAIHDAEVEKRIAQAFSKGLDWLLQNRPQSTEDHVFRLRGLIAAGADLTAIDAARAALLKEQLADGSWPQLVQQKGDAYATATALLALRAAGLPTEDEQHLHGVTYLLATQGPDGAWLVETRNLPIQVPFDNGDPGGTSQFISFMATNWATLALLEALPQASGNGRR